MRVRIRGKELGDCALLERVAIASIVAFGAGLVGERRARSLLLAYIQAKEPSVYQDAVEQDPELAAMLADDYGVMASVVNESKKFASIHFPEMDFDISFVVDA